MLAGHLQARNDLGLLELMHNDLTPAAGRILGGALGVNRGVKTLRVLFNDIGTEGYRLLCHGLEMNDTLKRVGHSGDTKTRVKFPMHVCQPGQGRLRYTPCAAAGFATASMDVASSLKSCLSSFSCAQPWLRLTCPLLAPFSFMRHHLFQPWNPRAVSL